MRQSELLTKTKKEVSKEEVSKNAQLLIKGGYIQKQMAGVYAYLPLGFKVLENIMDIIRDEMNALGGQEILLSALQDPEVWSKTNRWDESGVDIWFKTTLKTGAALGLGATHEEPLAKTMSEYISSYKDLPLYPYQIQLKFRNEKRAKSGIMRTREFLMKDLYSLSINENQHNEFYEASKQAYMNVFSRCGIGEHTFLTFASGGIFSEFSHEFQTISDAGEDIIYIDRKKNIAVNKEVYREDVLKILGLNKADLEEHKSIEVGNIFTLGEKFSKPLGLTYTNEQGEVVPVFMGSYGIGPGRLMGTVVEVLSDDKGIVWPTAITPYHVHLVTIGESEQILKQSQKVYAKLQDHGITVLWDDRDERPGAKLADSDLLGIPVRLIVSEKTRTQVELSIRTQKTQKVLSLTKVIKAIQSLYV